ncbi:hypothetical protein JW916_02965 [Candidatus Sumerlaeota bacterium]|nr:hypothetical protein [Candidatus Sumerlaeota bacterium]
MREIEIDDDVFFFLQSRAIPYVENPNMTLRRLFKFDAATAADAAHVEFREISDVPYPEGDGPRATAGFLSGDTLPVPIRPETLATRKRTRQTKTNLRVLIREGLLSEGQRLFLHGYDGQRIPGPEFQATIQGRNLIWAVDRQAYSMSDLATNLLKRLGHQATSVRGPSRWYTGEGRSIQELWAERERKGRRPSAPVYPNLEDHIPMSAR